MRVRVAVLRLAWVALCTWLGFFAGGSGDTNLLAGLALMVLTAPFSLIWWRYLYDYAAAFGERDTVQTVGTIIVILTAYLFWFEFLPRLRRWAMRK